MRRKGNKLKSKSVQIVLEGFSVKRPPSRDLNCLYSDSVILPLTRKGKDLYCFSSTSKAGLRTFPLTAYHSSPPLGSLWMIAFSIRSSWAADIKSSTEDKALFAVEISPDCAITNPMMAARIASQISKTLGLKPLG